MMADAVIHLIARIADEAAAARASAGASAPPASPAPPPPHLPADAPVWLPPPLIEGNDMEAADPVCHYGEDLHHLLIRSEGWEFLADVEKPGFVTNISGAVLDLYTGATAQTITFSFLQSYLPGMGAVTLTCHDGCECGAQVVDARHEFGGNIMKQMYFGVTPARNCTLRVTSEARPPLKGDGPPGMRFKVMGLAVGGTKAQPGMGEVVRALCAWPCMRVCALR